MITVVMVMVVVQVGNDGGDYDGTLMMVLGDDCGV